VKLKKEKKEQLIAYLKKNKIYVIIILVFIVYIFFFDEFNVIRINSDKHKQKNLEKERIVLQTKIEEDKKKLKILKNDPNAIERLAREQYYLKKDNEEVYVIIDEDK